MHQVALNLARRTCTSREHMKAIAVLKERVRLGCKRVVIG